MKSHYTFWALLQLISAHFGTCKKAFKFSPMILFLVAKIPPNRCFNC